MRTHVAELGGSKKYELYRKEGWSQQYTIYVKSNRTIQASNSSPEHLNKQENYL